MLCYALLSYIRLIFHTKLELEPYDSLIQQIMLRPMVFKICLPSNSLSFSPSVFLSTGEVSSVMTFSPGDCSPQNKSQVDVLNSVDDNYKRKNTDTLLIIDIIKAKDMKRKEIKRRERELNRMGEGMD